MPDVPQPQVPVLQGLNEDPQALWAVFPHPSDSCSSFHMTLSAQHSSMVPHHSQVQVYPFSLWPPLLPFLSTAPCCPDVPTASCSSFLATIPFPRLLPLPGMPSPHIAACHTLPVPTKLAPITLLPEALCSPQLQ